MREEVDLDTGLMIMENEKVNKKKGKLEKGSLLEKTTTVMTIQESAKELTPDREIEKMGSRLSELGSSPLRSFQSLNSSQSSERDKMIPYVAPLKEMKVLWFENMLSEEDCRNFNVIYESLLLEGKAGNLTNLTLGMVLAEKPLTWFQVMHERLKHLVMSSETFKEKEKAEHNAQAKAKQINRGKGIGEHSKGIRFVRVDEKGKGLNKKGDKTKVTPQRVTSRDKQTTGSTRVSYNELFCSLDFCAVHVLISVFHFGFTV